MPVALAAANWLQAGDCQGCYSMAAAGPHKGRHRAYSQDGMAYTWASGLDRVRFAMLQGRLAQSLGLVLPLARRNA